MPASKTAYIEPTQPETSRAYGDRRRAGLMGRKAHRTTVTSREDDALTAAIDRVYRKYGNDLRAFLRDLNAELTVRRQEALKAPKTR
jgi:hypothetical protein